MKVLITNDDGISADGLHVLSDWARGQGHQVIVVAPKLNASGQSGAITLGKPLTATEVRSGEWAVGGTPADCIRIAFAFLGVHPDLVLSGINHGLNLGQDVYASGTVGAARMAAIRGIAAAAFSMQGADWKAAARLLDRHIPTVIDAALAHRGLGVVSVNFPERDGERLVPAELSGPRYDDRLEWAEFNDNQHVVRLDFVPRRVECLERDTDADAVARRLSSLTILPLVPSQADAAPLTRQSLA